MAGSDTFSREKPVAYTDISTHKTNEIVSSKYKCYY